MKHTLLALLLAAGSLASAQLTKLSNNTNLFYGAPLNNSTAIFVQGESGALFVTDATPAGTAALAVPVVFDLEGGFVIWDNKFYFSGIGTSGSELWVTDGTAGGTSLIKDINPGTDTSRPEGFFLMNNQVYFFADAPGFGKELWKTDGTNAGTTMVKDINPGAAGSFTDITFAVSFNGVAYFVANTGDGVELWKTDGSEAGTVQVKDINTGPASSAPELIGLYNGKLYFTANDGIHGREVWTTTGSNATTSLLKDINVGPGGSDVTSIISYNNKFLFAAADGPGNKELWVTDGTTAGTVLFKDIEPGAGGSDPDVANSVVMNGKLIFTATTAATGTELFITDGTPGGTTLFKDIVAGSGSSSPFIMQDIELFNDGNSNSNLYNGKIFFQVTTAQDAQQLWITDGTPANTQLVKDFGPYGFFANSYFYTKSGLYFSASKGNFEFEVYKSEGTPATTNVYADINQNPGEGSFPFFQYFILNGKIFVTATDGDNDQDDFDLFVLGANEETLPLFLVQLGAAATDEAVALQWTTRHETNTWKFELQRSTDGQQFNTIAMIAATGNSNVEKLYEYKDKGASQLDVSTIYYRLKVIDKDGSQQLTKVVAVAILSKQISGILAGPNPARSEIRIQYSSANTSNVAISFLNVGGQQVLAWQGKAFEGQNQQTFDISSLLPGVYILRLRTQGQTYVHRFIKQ